MSVAALPTFDKILDYEPTEIVSFIKKERESSPVLLYCDNDLFMLLSKASDLKFILIEPGEEVDESFLRSLDSHYSDESYPLILTTSTFGTRAMDYRSQTRGITLIVANSFKNRSDYYQCMQRVGRFEDPCKRVNAFGDVLIDPK